MKYDPNFIYTCTHKRDCKEIALNVDNGNIIAGDLGFSSSNFCLFLQIFLQ